MSTTTYNYPANAEKRMQPMGESHSHSLGRFGTGYVDLVTGNLIMTSDDFSWSGQKMPVTIRHGYNSALRDKSHVMNREGFQAVPADFVGMTVGYGFHINWIQRVVAEYDDVYQQNNQVCYLYTDENADILAFIGDKTATKLTTEGYEFYPSKKEIKSGNTTYKFDSFDRLYQIANEIKCSDGSTVMLTNEVGYNSSDQIAYVQDGAGRKFTFEYVNNELRTITAPNGRRITYAYTSGRLSDVHYSDGRSIQLGYGGATLNYLLDVTMTNASGVNTYKVQYSYDSNGHVERVSEASYVDGTWINGQITEYEYDTVSRWTKVTTSEIDDNGISIETTTMYTFAPDGTLVNRYMWVGEDGEKIIPSGTSMGINPYLGDSDVLVTENVINLLEEHDFRTLNRWITNVDNDCGGFCLSSIRTRGAKFGDYAAYMVQTSANSCKKGMYQTTDTLAAGNYTFSVYAMLPQKAYGVSQAGVYLKVMSGTKILCETEHVHETGSEPTRLVASFHLDTAATVQLFVLVDGIATVYVSAAQLEACAYANKYNVLYNSSFDKDAANVTNSCDWIYEDAVSRTDAVSLNGSYSLMTPGDANNARYASQTVYGKKLKNVRETYILSGWAKGHNVTFCNPAESVEDAEKDLSKSLFSLMARITYTDGNTEDHFAHFDVDNDNWQYSSLEFCKNDFKAVESIKIFCMLNYATGTAYFDDIQLVCNGVETNLSASDFSQDDVNDTSTTGIDEITEIEDVETDDGFTEMTDNFGNNLTETTYHDGEFGTMYRQFSYTHHGNDLWTETDTRGNTTTYSVDMETSQNKAVTDRCGNITEYEYDDAGRTSCIRQKNTTSKELANVSYMYDEFDQLTEITRGDGMQYILNYNDFHKLEAIRVNGSSSDLVRYQYKNNNGRLKYVRYANGSQMEAKYNAYGQMVSEIWMRGSTLEAKYQYVYNSEGNIVRSIDNLAKKEYNYYYEDGKIMRSTQSTVTLNGDMVIAKNLDFIVLYIYDEEGELVRKTIRDADDNEFIYKYTNPKDENSVVTLPTGAVSQSKNDKFGRREFDELQLGRAFMSRHFTYHYGEISCERYEKGSLKSTPTTNLVKEITFQNDRTIEYEYDPEERITKVIDSVDGTTEYTYDSQGQLLIETRDGVVVNTMTYDGYGNILTKNGKSYVYCDNCWNDLLTVYDGQEITYDALGNPISYLGHSLTWEKGHRLRSFDNNIYTYNANGLRISKFVNNVQHIYFLDNNQIIQEEWGDNQLVSLYDNEESICGIIYNGNNYYFSKNQEGDILEILNEQAQVVAKYSYDAWGLCTISDDITDCGIASINPYRYRSYYFDEEIGLYYLQSRYYDPVRGRFISVDSPDLLRVENEILGHNLFSYCENNPVNESDPQGMLFLTKMIQDMLQAMAYGFVAGLIKQFYLDILKLAFHNFVLGNYVPFTMSTTDEYLESIQLEMIDALINKWDKYVLLAKMAIAITRFVGKLIFGKASARDWLQFAMKMAVIFFEHLCDKRLKKLEGQRSQVVIYKKKNGSRNLKRKAMMKKGTKLFIRIHIMKNTLQYTLPISEEFIMFMIDVFFDD